MEPDCAARTHRSLAALLYGAAVALTAELSARMKEAGYADVRGAHGCVFDNIEADGMRLTELAERAGMTKQAVGEAVTDLERLGYAERVADPGDGRAKIIRLTDRGHAAQRAGFQIIADIESEWAERLGAKRVRKMRSLLIDIGAAESRPPSAA